MPSQEEFLQFAHKLADRAGEVIKAYYRQPRAALGVEVKSDHSPIVTLADRGAETVLRDMVYSRWPDHGIIGEEFPSVRPGARYLWVFDPIDGTIAFSMGKPTFGTLIALFEGDEPILGIIDQPILKERWVGFIGRPTLFNGIPVSTQPAQSLEAASLAVNGLEQLSASDKDWDRIRLLRERFHVFCYGGDCYNYGLLANGYLDAVIEACPDLSDFAAIIPIVQGAGGKVTGWNGEKLTRCYTGGVLATSGDSIHFDILQLIGNHSVSPKE